MDISSYKTFFELSNHYFTTYQVVMAPYVINEIDGEKYILYSKLSPDQDWYNCSYLFFDDFRNENITKPDNANIYFNNNNDVWQYYPEENELASWKLYNPFQEKTLPYKLANIDIRNQRKIIEFCNKYGLLGEAFYRTREEWKKKPVSRVGYFCESLEYFQNEVICMRACLKVWYYILNHEEKTADLIETLHPDAYQDLYDSLNILFREIHKFNPLLGEEFVDGHYKKNSFKEENSVKLILLLYINQKLSTVCPQIEVIENSICAPSVGGFTVLGAAYYHLYKKITENGPIRKCLYCGRFFYPSKKTSKFCPKDYKWEKRSDCQNRYNVMKFRAKKKIAAGKVSKEEVAKELGRSISEINEWMTE
jgi:hypothetical protein